MTLLLEPHLATETSFTTRNFLASTSSPSFFIKQILRLKRSIQYVKPHQYALLSRSINYDFITIMVSQFSLVCWTLCVPHHALDMAPPNPQWMAMLSSLAKVVSPEETVIDAHPKRSLEVIPCGTWMYRLWWNSIWECRSARSLASSYAPPVGSYSVGSRGSAGVHNSYLLSREDSSEPIVIGSRPHRHSTGALSSSLLRTVCVSFSVLFAFILVLGGFWQTDIHRFGGLRL